MTNQETDEELIRRSKLGDKAAEEELVIRYADRVKSVVRLLYLAGGDKDDLFQESSLGLLTAIRTFDPEKIREKTGSQVTFSTYATICIRNKAFSAIRSANSEKHKPLNEYISLDADQDDDTAGSIYSYEAKSDEAAEPEVIYLKKELFEELTAYMNRVLSGMELQVAEMYYRECASREEIAERIGKDPRAVDNALTRIRTKLRSFVQDREDE